VDLVTAAEVAPAPPAGDVPHALVEIQGLTVDFDASGSRFKKGTRIVRATVKLNGKRFKTVKGKRLTAAVDLRGLPKGRFKVAIEIRTADGRRVTATRRYRTCAPKRKT